MSRTSFEVDYILYLLLYPQSYLIFLCCVITSASSNVWLAKKALPGLLFDTFVYIRNISLIRTCQGNKFIPGKLSQLCCFHCYFCCCLQLGKLNCDYFRRRNRRRRLAALENGFKSVLHWELCVPNPNLNN